MKQILIITRINPELSEFQELHLGVTEPVTVEYEDYRLSIFDGALLYDDEIDAIANNIMNKVDRDALEVLMVIHYASDDFESLSNTLLESCAGANWRVVNYSSKDTNYKSEIEPSFKAVVSDEKMVEKIYRLFYDPILEAKLHLLHSCITPTGIPSSLDKLLSKHQTQFDKFINEAAGANWDDPRYINALANLRDSLLEIW